MPRTSRIAPGDYIYHVHNRASGHLKLFAGPACYRDFLGLVSEAADVTQMRIIAYCVMPNHWHLLVWPRHEGDLRRFVRRFTIRHSHRWHVRNGSVGRGHVYQGRFKSFIVQDDAYLLTVCRYIERNPLRACLVTDATDWSWSSAAQRSRPCDESSTRPIVKLEPLPIELPSNWAKWVNEPQTEAELHRVRLHVRSGNPLAGLGAIPESSPLFPARPDGETPPDGGTESLPLKLAAGRRHSPNEVPKTRAARVAAKYPR